ncbi:MAG: three-Cys-motif partner protein TcmP [Hyphomonadaceae bacterium]
MPELENYAGREQAFVKHTFLETYLDGLLYKVGHVHDEIAYVDGFAGPWQSADEQFTDTSFGLALEKLRQVKSGLAQRGRAISVKAVLVEADAEAYARLETVPARYPDLIVRTIHGDFNHSISAINAELGRAFSFVFVDPKGWSVDMAELGKLISRGNCEVVFNFMFDFVNRFAGWEPVSDSMDRLFVGVDWRGAIDQAEDRKAAIHECFRQSLVHVGQYPYSLSTEVLKSTSDRVLYSLFYATRHPEGVRVFRHTQIKALTAQEKVRAELKQRAVAETDQGELFALHDMTRDETAEFLQGEQRRARDAMLAAAAEPPASERFGDVATRLMLAHVVRRVELGQIAAGLRKEGLVQLAPWPAKKRVPEDNYRIARLRSSERASAGPH